VVSPRPKLASQLLKRDRSSGNSGETPPSGIEVAPSGAVSAGPMEEPADMD